MTGPAPEPEKAEKNIVTKIVDSLYQASVVSVLGYTGLLAIALVIAAMIALKVVYVPEFHPK